METAPGLLEAAARWWPDRRMVIHGEQVWTYAEVNRWANRIANALLADGLRAGEPVALFLPSRPLFVAAYYAVMKAGGITAPLNAMFTPPEVRAMVEYLGAERVISLPEMSDGLDLDARILNVNDLATCGHESDPGLPIDPKAVATIFHTSGTTGRPKGAAQTHVNLVAGGRQMVVHSGWRNAAEHLVCPLPLFNNFGSTAILNMVTSAAATMTIVERWDADAVLTAFRRGATRMAGTPTMYIYLLEAYRPADHGTVELDPCIVGGQTTPVEVRQSFESTFGGRMLNLYGATETHAVTLTPLHGPFPLDSVGHPIGQSTVVVVNEDGAEVAPGEIGELVLGGDTVCASYWRDQERTAESFSALGWHSGDLGYLDADGYVHVVDRKKDLIITGGANIYPAEIEAVIYTHPEVVMAAVVGLPDPVKGETPKAFIVVKEGSALDAETMNAFLRSQLAAYKCPRSIELVDSLPTSAVGKVLKRELREQILARSGPGEGSR